jgi:hypothetical protein
MEEFTPPYMAKMWYDAASSELGMRWPIQSENAQAIMNRLYETRKDIGDPCLEGLSIYIPLGGDYIYIYHRAEATLD